MSRGRPLLRHYGLLATMAGLAASASACGDDDNNAAQQADRCGDVGAWSIAPASDATNGGVVGLIGDRVVSWSDAPGMLRRLHIASDCGDGAIDVILEGSLEGDGTTVVAGPDLVVLAEDAALRLDLNTGESHPLFGAVFETMESTPMGLLALGLGGKILLHPNPADASAEATVLLDGLAWLPRPGAEEPPTWPHLWTDGSQTFGLTIDFELMRVPLNGAEPQLELVDVEEFHILDGGRKVAWREIDGDTLVVTNLDNDEEFYSSPQPAPNWDAQEVGRWALITTDRGRLLNLDTGVVVEPVDFNPTRIVETGTDSALLVGNPNGSVALGYWLIGPGGELSSFLAPDGCLDFDSKVTPLGVIVPDGECDPQNTLYNAADVMMLHPYDRSAPQTLGERAAFVYWALDGDFIVSWDEAGGSGFGEMTADSPDSDPRLIADHVTIAEPVIDARDVYYFQDGVGVERYRLPE